MGKRGLPAVQTHLSACADGRACRSGEAYATGRIRDLDDCRAGASHSPALRFRSSFAKPSLSPPGKDRRAGRLSTSSWGWKALPIAAWKATDPRTAVIIQGIHPVFTPAGPRSRFRGSLAPARFTSRSGPTVGILLRSPPFSCHVSSHQRRRDDAKPPEPATDDPP